MSLKLFWVGHFQVSYTLCYPIPSFISQFEGKVYEAQIAYPDNPSPNLEPTDAHNSKLSSHRSQDLPLSNIKPQTYKSSDPDCYLLSYILKCPYNNFVWNWVWPENSFYLHIRLWGEHFYYLYLKDVDSGAQERWHSFPGWVSNWPWTMSIMEITVYSSWPHLGA